MLRDLVVALLRSTGHAALADTARLCTSEVVTNVYRHTTASIVRVDVMVGEGSVTVSVHDDQPRDLPRPGESKNRDGGLGLILVNESADEWGVTQYGGLIPRSKAVWFVLKEDGKGIS